MIDIFHVSPHQGRGDKKEYFWRNRFKFNNSSMGIGICKRTSSDNINFHYAFCCWMTCGLSYLPGYVRPSLWPTSSFTPLHTYILPPTTSVISAAWLRICGSLGLTYGLFNLLNPPQIVAERGWAQEAWAGGCHGRPKKAWTDEARSLLGNVLCVGCPQLLVIRNYEFV